MLQHLDRFEFDAFRFWLRNTVRELENVTEPTIIPTTDENVVWAVRFTKGRVYWALRECDYANEHAAMFRIRDGRIVYMKDYFNPLAFYRALNINCPPSVMIRIPMRRTPACRRGATQADGGAERPAGL